MLRWATLLAGVTALSRLPFVTDRLWEWDSVLYARALEGGFHVSDVLAASRPHPPGYVLYVAVAAVGRLLGLDSDHALVAESVLASAVAVGALFLLCARLAGPAIGALVAVAFAVDPLVWVHGEVAMPYILLAAVTTVVAAVFRVARDRGARAVVAASALFGALAGFRQDLLLFLFPLWLWLVLPRSWRIRAASAGGLAAACLLWFVPSALLSDGPVAYVGSVWRQLANASGASGAAGRSVSANLALLAQSLVWGLLAFALVLAALLLARALASVTRRAPLRREEPLFFALWILPPLLFYAFVHIGEWGYLLSTLPALYALLAWLLRGPARALPPLGRRAGAALLALAALGSASVFVFGGDSVFSADALASRDRSIAERVSFVRDTLPPDAAVVLAGNDLLTARYYLPAYRSWYADARAGGTYTRDVAAPVTLVLFDAYARLAAWPAEPRALRLPSGETVLLVTVSAPARLTLPGRDLDATPR